MATKRKRQTDASKIRKLAAAGFTKEQIIAKGFTRQQWESALQHTKPMGRPPNPICPLCGNKIPKKKLGPNASP